MQLDLFTTKKELNEYERRQLEKALRYQDRAKRAATQSEATLKQVRAERNMIPLGQPILVGHHSEKAHRNHLNRLENRERRGWEEHDKAKHYEESAERIIDNIENDRVISSDDPDAIEKLQAKIVKLEEERTKYKEYNRKARAEGKDQLPGYVLKNLAGNIRSVKERIKSLQALAETEERDEEINGIRLVTDKDDNRVRLIFPGKPSEEIRSELKSHGFRWFPRAGAWQRNLNNSGVFWAEHVIEKIGEMSNVQNS